jgi:hypothetical protein
MKKFAIAAFASAALFASPLIAQDDGGGEVVVTGSRISRNMLSDTPITVGGISYKPPVIGLKRQADSAVRTIEIVSDSRDEAMRRREVQAMLLDAIDRAKKDGVSLVTGNYELVELTRTNWQDQFPGLAGKVEDEDDDDDEDESEPGYEDSGGSTTIRLKVKTKLEGSIDAAQKKITAFIKAVPATGRSLIGQQGGLALTIIKPEQYRDEIYKRIAEGAKHAVSFYGGDYHVDVTGLSNDIAWQQVSNTEVFLYIPYSFSVGK